MVVVLCLVVHEIYMSLTTIVSSFFAIKCNSNLLGMLHLLKLNVPKLVWHYVASVIWEIAALILGSTKIDGGALCFPHIDKICMLCKHDVNLSPTNTPNMY